MAALIGELVQWDNDRGFGFIAGSDGQRYFVHISSIGRIVNRPRIGDSLSFRPGLGRDGRPAALSASILGANPRSTREVVQRGLPAEPARLDWRLPLALLLAGLLITANLLDRLPWVVSLAYVAMGALSLLLYRLDKGFAENGQWRISEVTLLGVDLCLGVTGGLLGQALFRHKTRKPSYVWAVVVIAATHVLWLGGIALGLIDMGTLRELIPGLR